MTYLLGVCLLLCIPGCYAGVAVLVVGLIAASSGGGSSSNRPPETPVIGSTERVDGGRILVRYVLVDDDGGPIDVSIDWLPADGPQAWRPAAEYGGEVRDGQGMSVSSEGTMGISLDPNEPRELAFIWDARRDLRESIGSDYGSVRLKIRSREGEQSSEGSGETEPFVAGNEPPVVEEITGKTEGAGPFNLTVLISDSTSDSVTLKGFFRVGRTRGPESQISFTDGTDLAFLSRPKSEGGRKLDLQWESDKDLPGQVLSEVFIRLEINDAYDPKANGPPNSGDGGSCPCEFGAISLDNNIDPTLEFLAVTQPRDGSFGAPNRIRYVLRDDEKHPLSVILQWALAGESFPPLTNLDGELIAGTPSPAELEFLRNVLTNSEEPFVRKRSELHILSEAPVWLRGRLDDSTALERNQIRETDFVRAGLLFRPSSAVAGDDEDPPEFFLVGREIHLVHSPTSLDEWRRVQSFDPGTSIASLDRPLPFSAPPGTMYELRANAGMTELAGDTRGRVHSLVWDPLRDLKNTFGPDLSSEIHLQGRAVDSQMGPPVTLKSPVRPAEDLFIKLEQDLYIKRTPEILLTDGAVPVAVAIGDLNSDGRSDLAAVAKNDPSGGLLIFFQSKAGEIPTFPSMELSAGVNPVAVTVADVSGDGKDDILVVDPGASALLVHIQVPREGEPPAREFLSFSLKSFDGEDQPVAVAAGDLNGDGRRDVIVANAGDNTLSLFLQDDKGTLVKAGEPVTGLSQPSAIAIGDLNGDKLNDIVVTNAGLHTAWVFLQVVDPKTLEHSLLPVATPALITDLNGHPVSVALGDLEGDGRLDLVVANQNSGTLRIFFQEKFDDPGAAVTIRAGPGSRPVSVAIEDVDGDSFGDLVVADERMDTVNVFLNDGSGGFPDSHPHMTFASGKAGPGLPLPKPTALALGDLNGDGRPDLVVANEGNGEIGIFLRNSAGDLLAGSERQLKTGPRPSAVAVGDVNSDGQNDVVVVNQHSNSAGVYFQDPLGRQGGENLQDKPNLTLTTVSHPVQVALGDLDGDGRNDLVVTSGISSALSIFHHKSSGGLLPTESQRIDTNGDPSAAAIGDLNGDGRNDLVVALGASSVAAVYFQTGARDPTGAGEMLFEPPQELPVGVFPAAVAIGDLNGDGRNDLAVANELSSTISIYLQSSARELEARPEPLIAEKGAHPVAITIGDVNGDGREDLLVANLKLNSVGVYFQDCDGNLSTKPDRILVSERDRSPTSISVGDLDGDGRNDAVVVYESSKAVGLYLQRAAGGLPLSPTRRQALTFAISSAALGDLDGNGRKEVVLVNTTDNQLSIFHTR